MRINSLFSQKGMDQKTIVKLVALIDAERNDEDKEDMSISFKQGRVSAITVDGITFEIK